MKKLMTLMLGLSLAMGAVVSVSLADEPTKKEDSTTKKKKGKKGKKDDDTKKDDKK